MNPTISTNFFSREAMLKRQARTIRSRKLHPTMNKPLNIIVEEDESRSSSPVSDYAPSTSSGGSHTLGLKARRRHANVSDINISCDVPTHDNNDLSPLLLSSSNTTSSTDSPDSFKLTFTDIAFKFPHPPTPSPTSQDRTGCTSPTHSINSLSSSPRSQHESMPLTPNTSDDESSFSSRSFNPRRAAIQPLVITKHNPRPTSPSDEISISPSLLQPFKNSSESLDGPPAITPLTSAFMDKDSEDESEPESDSEWYNNEFSQILSLYSPIPQSFPIQNSRPESTFISDDPSEAPVATRPSSKRRVSRTFPRPSSAASRRESSVLPVCQLDLVSATKRSSKRISIPKYPPPPVPSMSTTHLPVPTCAKVLPQSARRPPPRSSIPADCDFDLELDEVHEGDDSSSAFSFSMYEIDLDNGVEERNLEPESPGSSYSSRRSVYSQPSYVEDEEFGGVTFDLDYSMMLPLSLPTTPMDLEADIAIGLEKLRSSEGGVQVEQQPISVVVEEQTEEEEQQQPQPEQEVVNDVFSPLSSTFSFSPPPSATFYADSPSYFPLPESSSSSSYYLPPKRVLVNEEKTLKSKWSSSTLASVREEHEHEHEQRRSASKKLRLYFGGQTSPAKRLSEKQKVPPTPTSPFSLLASRKPSQTRSPAAAASPSPSPATPSHNHNHSPSPSPSPKRTHSRGGSRNSNSDVMIIGYGAGVGVRRRGSVSTVSDVGSEDSSSSTSSSGLRRKPIPVEMFLRTAA